MRSRIALGVVLALLCSCAKKAADTPSVDITDDQITSFLAWTREWGELAMRHAREGQEVAARVAPKYSMSGTPGMTNDPELRATLDRQRAAIQEHMDRIPLNDAQVKAWKATVAGLIPRRDDQVLAAARQKYGDRFVDRVLARERDITATLPH
jgi:hypothetical protein